MLRTNKVQLSDKLMNCIRHRKWKAENQGDDIRFKVKGWKTRSWH